MSRNQLLLIIVFLFPISIYVLHLQSEGNSPKSEYGRQNMHLNEGVVFVKVSEQYCGRMKNRALVTENGKIYCARYRESVEFIQGEYYTSVLASVLGINNVPEIYIKQFDPEDKTWSRVWEALAAAGWRRLAVVSMTRFIPNLHAVNFPQYMKHCGNCKITEDYLKLVVEDQRFLNQWTDMIVLDYLTGDVDRVIGHVHNLQWDSHSLDRAVHNLMETERGSLVFLDNESAFGHSYRLVSLYQHHHNVTLERICVFPAGTTKRLVAIAEIADRSFNIFKKHFIGNSLIPPLPNKDILTLKSRLQQAAKHVKHGCS